MGQDLLGKPLIEGHKHRPKILRAPSEIHSTMEKFLADRDRFSKLVRLLVIEPLERAPNLIYAQGKSSAGFLSAVVEARSHKPALMTSAFVYQIRYDAAQEVDHDLLPLDNTANERPDWFEYWTIRTFLRTQPLDENAFYGFLSPRFKSKTNLSGREVHEFIRRHGDTADVLLFTPSLHLTAYYLNVFKYGDSCHPGLLGLATRLFRRIGRPTNFDTFITHSGNEVYSNYFVARPRFWRAWIEVTEQLFAIAESKDDPLGMELRRPTKYRGAESVEIKVFLIERVATWVLARESQFVVKARDPFIARSRLYKLPGAIVCDAVKIAYQRNGRSREFADLFRIVSKSARGLSLLLRLGSFWRIEPARRCVAALATYWKRPERPA